MFGIFGAISFGRLTLDPGGVVLWILASLLAGWLAAKITDKTIVLTGAMVPYKFGSSDGLFNLGSALAFAQTLAPGVYVAMNGRCFP